MAKQAAKEGVLEKRETAHLIAADKIQGTTVYNARGEKLGAVERLMIDKTSGRVAYAVISFDGFLGIGDRHHPLPWAVLRYDPGRAGYVVDLEKKALEGAPTIAITDEYFDWSDDEWNRRVHDYYMTPLY